MQFRVPRELFGNKLPKRAANSLDEPESEQPVCSVDWSESNPTRAILVCEETGTATILSPVSSPQPSQTLGNDSRYRVVVEAILFCTVMTIILLSIMIAWSSFRNRGGEGARRRRRQENENRCQVEFELEVDMYGRDARVTISN